MATYGEKLASFPLLQWMEQRQLSCAEVAILCAVSRRTVTRWRTAQGVPAQVLRLFQAMQHGAPSYSARGTKGERRRAETLPHWWRQTIYGSRATDGDWRTWVQYESPEAKRVRRAREKIDAARLAAMREAAERKKAQANAKRSRTMKARAAAVKAGRRTAPQSFPHFGSAL